MVNNKKSKNSKNSKVDTTEQAGGFLADAKYLAHMRLTAAMNGRPIIMVNQYDLPVYHNGRAKIPYDSAAVMLPNGRIISVTEARAAGHL